MDLEDVVFLDALVVLLDLELVAFFDLELADFLDLELSLEFELFTFVVLDFDAVSYTHLTLPTIA